MVDSTPENDLGELTKIRGLYSLKSFQTACTELIRRSLDEAELLNSVCKAAVELGRFSMCWVGYPNDDTDKSIIPIAFCGSRSDVKYLLSKRFSWVTQNEFTQDCITTAIQSCQPVICADIQMGPMGLCDNQEARELGYRGVAFLPLADQDIAFGILGLYSMELRVLEDSDITVLQEITTCISLEVLRLRKQDEAKKVIVVTQNIASSISVKKDNTFFESSIRNAIETFQADAGIIASICLDNTAYAESIAAIVDGQVVDNLRYRIQDTPCGELLTNHDCVVSNSVAKQYPKSRLLFDIDAEAYIGTQLYNPDGQVVGFIYLVFRNPLKHSGHIRSTLHMFAYIASSELEYLSSSELD